MTNFPVTRCHYRALLQPHDASALSPLLAQCEANARALLVDHRLMTAGLYYYNDQLFLYYEALGEPFSPDAFMTPLTPLLTPWPQKDATSPWAMMYPIYWHDVPRNEADWTRPHPPERRRGRIAYLRPEKLWGYVKHHIAIVEEGLLKGDRYQSIALHEDVLFSYFEEPRGSVNIRRCEDGESTVINDWLAADPESHFIPLPGSNGANFLLLPEYFTVG